MKFTLEIHCDNEAFQDDPCPAIANILNGVAERMHDGEYNYSLTLFDRNGNAVGKCVLQEE
jgi:hypothetical protein